ncbi:MAG: YgiQ family radical SAM protein, partial [Synergistaceae bacterium]|nr:YgiQ family radical SAM protein [Synergistaceae bacterium]
MNKNKREAPLPMSKKEMRERGWAELDFLCVTGDAYVDHPSFGAAIVSRVLESMGFRVGIAAQPDWRGTDDFAAMGRPKLAVMVAAGNLDSMLSNYSSPGKRRAKDDYAPDGEPRRRPDRATIVYCNRIRELWGDIPLVIGGIEASLRRMAHYDY